MVLKKQKFNFEKFINKIRKKSEDRWGNVGYPDIDETLLETCGYKIDEPEYLDDEKIFSERYNAKNDFLLLDKSFKYTKIMQILDNEPEGFWYSFVEYGYLSSKKTEYSFLISAGDYNINYSIGPIKAFKRLKKNDLKNITKYVVDNINFNTHHSNNVVMNRFFNWNLKDLKEKFKVTLDHKREMNKDSSFKWPETYKRVHFTIVDEKRFNDSSWELKNLTNKETYDFIK